MKKLFTILTLVAAVVFSASAQTNPPTFIKGTLDIKYNSRQASGSVKGVKDNYLVNINVCNSAVFQGTITDQPQIIEGLWNKSVTQPRVVNYDLDCIIMNPKNPAQTKNVGKLAGTVPIAPDGLYQYDKGTLSMDILPIAAAPGFSAKFKGTINGKPMGRPANWLDTFKGNAISITRSVNGKTTTVLVKRYDRMVFNQAELGSGPVQFYAPVVVSGEMLYDYDKNCWFFNNVSLTYGGHYDRITGTIRWVESPNRSTNGEGEYDFDVRVNEPPPSETAAFAAPSDESAFFSTDTSVPALNGTMKYKDTLRGDTTLASHVEVDLHGNNLTKQQTMALCKVIIFASVVPMNAD